MDWDSFESRFRDELGGFCRQAIADHPGKRLYCVAIYLFYCDYRVIMLPPFAAATREWLAALDPGERELVRWSPADFPIQQQTDWEDAAVFPRRAGDWLTGLARAGGAEAADSEAYHRAWDAVLDRAVDVVCGAARTVMDELLAEGEVAADFALVSC
jgi:hypothetical protein